MVSALDDVPAGRAPQTGGLGEFQSVATLSPAHLVAYFRANPQVADRLPATVSYHKRFSPSTFIEETDSGYRVGWFDHERRQLRNFTEFSEAAADYLLFSFGRGRLRRSSHLTNRCSQPLAGSPAGCTESKQKFATVYGRGVHTGRRLAVESGG